jgi:iron complex outermembrane receptor protein
MVGSYPVDAPEPSRSNSARRIAQRRLPLPFAFGVAGALFAAAPVRADDTVTAAVDGGASGKTEQIVVEGRQRTDAQQAQTQLDLIPGGTSLILSDDVAGRREATSADLLALQPGVFAQSAGGTDSIKISIRGSGINRGTGFFRSGIKFTISGLPVTGPSGTPYELFEPLGLQYTEILRGSNAFTLGALALGGAINYQTNTGRTAPGYETRLELGSFGYAKAQASAGGVDGPLDYYISATGERRSGFQDHTESEAQHLAANLGYQLTPDVETRFFFNYGRENFKGPGYLTRVQILSDPRQANQTALQYNYDRLQPGSELVGNVTTIRPDEASKLEIGLAYQNFPIRQGASSTAVPTYSYWTYGNVAAQAKYTRAGELFDRDSNWTVAAYTSQDVYGTLDRYGIGPGNFNYGTAAAPFRLQQNSLITRNDFSGSSDNVVLFSNDTQVVPDLWLTVGAAGIATRRAIDVPYGVNRAGGIDRPSYDKTRFNWEPNLGLRYDVSPDLQVFTNFSRSIEPRNDWSGVIGPTNGPNIKNWSILDLNNQEAWTEEVGGRGRYGIFQGSVSYYHAQVKNEILTLTDPTTLVQTELNASPTTHQGIEFALETLLWHDSSARPWHEGGEPEQRLVYRQAYTWSDFHFDHDPTFHQNKEAGLPEHYYQGSLDYEHPSGFYASFTLQAASGYYIDYANTFKTNPYVVYGLGLGWQQPRPDHRGWQVSLDFRNLTDKHYAQDISPAFNVKGVDSPVSDPGDGFGVFSAVSYKF